MAEPLEPVAGQQPLPLHTPVMLPNPVLTVPTHPEENFAMRHSDWQRLRERIGAVKQPANWVSQVGWAAVGVAASSLLALFPWMAARSQLPQDAKNHYAWITPLLAVAGFAMAIIAVLCLVLSRALKDVQQRSITSICEDMDALYEPHRRAEPGRVEPI